MDKKPKRRRRTKGGFYFVNTKGIEYEVIFRKPSERAYDGADGVCLDPNIENPKIYISPYLTKQSELNTIIHEFCHAFFWDKPENDVFKFANSLSRFLYSKHGWRKTKQ